MGHYKSNLRDIEFNLFEVLGRDKVYGTGPFEEMDVETAKSILDEIRRLAENELAESFADADRNPPVFDPETNTAPVPATFKKSYNAFMESEYWRLGIPEEIGGTVSPRSLIWAYAELLLGSNPAIWMYSSGPAFAGILYNEGNEAQKKVAQIAVEKRWGSTMVLTEPDAGSDVGAGRTKATQQEDGSWHIEGVKRFITSGEHDMEENILHYVLARPEGAGPGTKGLSLFLVPKYEFDWETGELGARNGVYATNVEHKMGLKASNTCEMTFGDKHPAKGWLIGDKHDGIRQMFLIIEFARMMVGTKAISTLSTGYLNALEYAKERVQGTDLANFMDKAAPKVTITHHPDVRRSLMTQKAYAEGMRSLVLYTASVQDEIAIKEAAGEDAKALHGLNDLLLPIVKGYGSEKGYEQLAQSLQTFGGSGFLQEYPIEQYIRDAKIDTLYEGTTAIQGQDCFFRKIGRVQAHALLSPEGVDLNTGMLLGWSDSGASALLSCSIAAGTPMTASVTGSLGRIDVPSGFFFPERFTLHRAGHEPEEFTTSDDPHSLRHEAAEVMRCLRAGETESPLVPLDGSLAVMRTLDAVRDRVGVRYPQEAVVRPRETADPRETAVTPA